MPRFERSKGRRDSKRGPPRRDSRDSREFNRDRRDVHMTKVTCSSCGEECEVPFKPSSDKPVYCDECFSKKGKGGSDRSSKDFAIINEKLDKIMKALKVE